MVEDHRSVSEGEVRLGYVQIVRRRQLCWQLLKIAHGVVGEVADGAADEGWQVRQRGYALTAHDLGQPPKRVGGWHLAYPVSIHDGVEAAAVGEGALGVEAQKGEIGRASCR